MPSLLNAAFSRFEELTPANTGIYDCCAKAAKQQKGCVRNRAVVYTQEDEIRTVEPDADKNVALALGYRYNVMPFSEEVLLRDCQFTPAISGLEAASNTYVAVS